MNLLTATSQFVTTDLRAWQYIQKWQAEMHVALQIFSTNEIVW